jgi:PAS domain S-box-containing protein
MTPLKLVIIDDEEVHFMLMKRAIDKVFPLASVDYFEEASACLERLNELTPDVIITDYLMPGMNGIEFLEALNKANREIPVVMITGQGDENTAVRAMKLGAWDYLVKSGDFFTLLPSVIEKVIREKNLKESLGDSERRFQDLAERTSDWIWEIDVEGRYVYSNPIVEEVIGYQPAELIGKPLHALFREEDMEVLRESISKIMAKRESLSVFEHCVVHKDKHEVILETNAVPFYDRLGRLSGYRGIHRDITERRRAQEALRKAHDELEMRVRKRTKELSKANEELRIEIAERNRAEEALRDSEQQLNSIIRTVPDIIYRLDTNGTITFISDAVTRYGYSSEDLIKSHMLDLVYPDDRQKATYRINERRTGERSTKSLEIRLLPKQRTWNAFTINPRAIDGQPVFLVTAVGLYRFDKPETENFIGTQGIAKDISVRKGSEQEREKLIKELQDALAEVKKLSGLLPICASCKKIRDDKGYWNQIETYIREHSEAEFSHGICPDCGKKLYGRFYKERL